jgi:peptide/nickel transport system substrate-binding protein
MRGSRGRRAQGSHRPAANVGRSRRATIAGSGAEEVLRVKGHAARTRRGLPAAVIALALLLSLALWLPPARGVAKDSLTIGLSSDASFINALIASDGQSYKVEWSVFDCLVAYDETLAIRPQLAESWETSPDGLSYTFHLRKDVVWQDGRPFTADDVAFWMYSMLNPKVRAPSRAFFGGMAGYAELTNPDHPADPAGLPRKPVEVLNPSTVRLNLAYPYAAFLGVLTCPRGGIVPKHALEGKDMNTAEFNSRPVGTGPYRVVEWRKGESIALEAFDRYYGGRAPIRRLIFRIIPDPVVRTQALRTAGIDMLDDPPTDELDRFAKDPRYAVAGIYTPTYQYLGYRLDRPPFSDLRVRQAFSHAVDFDVIVRKVLRGYAVRATGPLPPTSWAYTPKVRRYPYDPEKAKQLLAEAGYTDPRLRGHHSGPARADRSGGRDPAAGLPHVRPPVVRIGFRSHPRGVDGTP